VVARFGETPAQKRLAVVGVYPLPQTFIRIEPILFFLKNMSSKDKADKVTSEDDTILLLQQGYSPKVTEKILKWYDLN
jgi:hypothetical protein